MKSALPAPSLGASDAMSLLGVAELDTLDGAIEMLGTLQGDRGTRRRGRIDVAALLYAIAPNARIEIAPGEGTEVFGEEGALSRMLHVLLHQAVGDAPLGSASPEVHVERQGDLVHVGVDLGPDSSANSELERRWLAHMANRFGGRIELGGGRQTLVLPAEGVDEKSEVVALRRELEEAQALGETYAIELATILTAVQNRTEEHGAPPSSRAEPSFSINTELAAALARATSRAYDAWFEALRERVNLVARQLGPAASVQDLAEHVTAGAELLSGVAAFGDSSTDEPPSVVVLAALGQEVSGALAERAEHVRVTLGIDVASDLTLIASRGLLTLLVREMLTHAIEAADAECSVVLRARRLGSDIELSVAEVGQQLPTVPGTNSLPRREPAQVGRPPSMCLIVARATAIRLGGSLGQRIGENGRTELWARLRSL